MPRRWRQADQITTQPFTARLPGEQVRLIQAHRAHLGSRPHLYEVFAEASLIAAAGDRNSSESPRSSQAARPR